MLQRFYFFERIFNWESQYSGVYWHKINSNWVAQRREPDGTICYGGSFSRNDEVEAAKEADKLLHQIALRFGTNDLKKQKFNFPEYVILFFK